MPRPVHETETHQPEQQPQGEQGRLLRHQSPSGRWDADGFAARCTDGACSGAGAGWADPGLTGLATLAFLGAGHTHRFGRHKRTVSRTLQWMLKVQRADGLVGRPDGHYMYN